MSKVKKTYKEIIEFEAVCSNYFVRTGAYNPETKQFSDEKETKFVLDLKNIGKQWKKLYEEFQEKVNDLRITHCLEDATTKKIIRNADNSYAFSKEGERAFSKAYKDLIKEEITLHARITTGDWKLTDEEKEAFSGLVIPEITKTEEPTES